MMILLATVMATGLSGYFSQGMLSELEFGLSYERDGDRQKKWKTNQRNMALYNYPQSTILWILRQYYLTNL